MFTHTVGTFSRGSRVSTTARRRGDILAHFFLATSASFLHPSRRQFRISEIMPVLLRSISARAVRGLMRMSTLSRSDPYSLLGLSPGATKAEIKSTFYKIAKQAHPDVVGNDGPGPGGVTFVEALAAYEALIAECEEAEREQGRTAAAHHTAPNSAARGGRHNSSGRRGAARRPPQARSQWRVGELLCEQLLDADCDAFVLDTVWSDVKSLHRDTGHGVSEFMLDALFGACSRTGGGLDAAVELLHDGRQTNVFSTTALQTAAVCAMMKWCSEDERMTFEFAVGLVDEWRRTPEDFERLQSAYYVHFGDDPLCVGFWKS